MKTMADLIDRNAAYYPQVTAFAFGDRSLTYRQYAERSRMVASALYRLGVRRQDRVGILSVNNLEYLELFGGCEYAGYIAALYNFRLAEPEIAWLLQDSAPKVVVFEAQFAELIANLRPRFPEIQHYICIDGTPPEWAVSFESLVGKGDPSGPPLRALADDYVYLFYTSGTTGRPKGVPYRQSGALEIARSRGSQLGDDLRVLQVTPFFHIGGKGFPLASMWMAGTTVVQSAFDPLRFMEAIQKHRITFTFMVAPMIQALLEHPQFAEFDLRSLRSVMSASAAIPVELLRRAIEELGPVLYVAYGSTEGGGICTLNRHELKPFGDEHDLRRLRSVGHFDPEAEAVILDEDGGLSPQGQIGEICVKSPVFEGYWNNTVATIEALEGGWLHTGDLGYMDEEGYVFLVDRKKDMIISGGENIYSREVEDALETHPAVNATAVIGIPDDKWGEAVKAIVTLRAGFEVSEEELVAHCRTRLARYKCPRTIQVVADLPRLGTGKLDKVTLRKHHQSASNSLASTNMANNS